MKALIKQSHVKTQFTKFKIYQNLLHFFLGTVEICFRINDKKS